MSKIRIDLTLEVIISENGVSVNSLIYQLAKMMPEIFFAILRCVFSAVEEQIIKQLKESFPGRYVKNGHRKNERHIRTPFGLFKYKLAQIKDKIEWKTLLPLYKKIFIPSYKQHVPQTIEPAAGLVIHLSYRRSTKEVERIKEVSMSHTTLYRHFQAFAEKMCSFPDLKNVPYRFLMADGTKVLLQEKNKEGKLSREVDMRWVLASLEEDQPFEPIGFYIDKRWEEIKKDLEKRIDYSKIEVLFSDGERGILENLLDEGMRHQPCLLHGKRDFAYLLYEEGLKKPKQEPFQEKLNSIPALKLNKKKLEEIKPEDLPKVKELAQKTKQGFQDLLEILDEKKYPKARTYIENFSRNVSTFFDWWLATGEWIPLTTNALENDFSQVNNRIKVIGKRWSEKGLLNWLKVAMNKIFFPEMWSELWKKYLNLTPLPEINLINVSYSWI